MKENRVKTFFWKEYHPFDTSNYSLYPTKVNIKGYTWYLIPFMHSIFNGQYFRDAVLQTLPDFWTGIYSYCFLIDFLWNFLPGRCKIGRLLILHLRNKFFVQNTFYDWKLFMPRSSAVARYRQIEDDSTIDSATATRFTSIAKIHLS